MKKSKSILRFGAMLLVLTIFIPSISWALDDNTDSTKIFVKIDGVDGSSQDHRYDGWIDAIAFNAGVSQPSGAASSGGARSAEKASFSDLSIWKGFDRATALLCLKVCNGEHIKEVILEVVQYDQVIYKIILEDVMVTSVRTDVEKDKSLGTAEVVTMNYGAITWVYTEIDRGRVRGDIATNWNVHRNDGY